LGFLLNTYNNNTIDNRCVDDEEEKLKINNAVVMVKAEGQYYRILTKSIYHSTWLLN